MGTCQPSSLARFAGIAFVAGAAFWLTAMTRTPRAAVRCGTLAGHVVPSRCSVTGTWTREELLEAAMNSPRFVGLHDKPSWLSMFADDALIEDPVGSPPSGPDPESRSLFYDTFIAPNIVTLHPNPQRDGISNWIAVKRRTVVRCVNITAQFSNGAMMKVPVHVVYRFNDSLLCQSLRAHWEVIQNKPQLQTWTDALPAMIGSTKTFAHIFATRGLSYTVGYLNGTMVTGAGRSEKRSVVELAAALMKADVRAFADFFAPGAVVSFPVQDTDFTPADFGASGVQGFTVSGLRSGGQWVSFDFVISFAGGKTHGGVGLCEFPPDQRGKVGVAELYWE